MLEMQDVLAILSRHREKLQAAGVKSLAVFGSLSRGEATAASDIFSVCHPERREGSIPASRGDLGEYGAQTPPPVQLFFS